MDVFWDMSGVESFGEEAMLRQQAEIRRFRCPIRDAGIESGTVTGCLGAACAASYRAVRASISPMPSGNQDGTHE